MKKAELVELEPHETDRRATYVIMTKKGKEIYETACDIVENFEYEKLIEFDAESTDTMVDILKRLAE
jgi:DNA-binding MarR family transcriptional regulator